MLSSPLSPLSLSIVIPTSDILIDKEYATICGNGHPLVRDDSFWSLAFYEVWGSYLLFYRDLKEMIKCLYEDMDCSIFYSDFSKETREKFETERSKITEGVAMLYMVGEEEKAYELIPDLIKLVKITQDYDMLALNVSTMCDMYKEICNHIRQLHVDIQVSSDKTDLPEFKKEKGLIEVEMNTFKEIGGTVEEMEYFEKLMDGVEMGIKDLE